MSNGITQINYEQMQQVAQKFAEEAERIRRNQTTLTGKVDRLRGGGWLADAATQFYREVDDSVFPAVVRLEQAYTQAAQVCGVIAEIMRRAEEEAANCLKEGAEGGSGGGGGSGGSWGGPPQTAAEWWNYIKNLKTVDGLLGLIGLSSDDFSLGKPDGKPGPIDAVAFFAKLGWAVAKGEITWANAAELISEKFTSEALSYAIGLHPYGALALGVDALLQAGSSVTGDAATIYRDLLTGFDPSLRSHQLMTEGIQEYRDIFEDASLGTVLDSASRLYVDIAGETPFGMGASPANIPLALAYQAMFDPQQFKETMYDAAGLMGDTGDFANGLLRLPTAGQNLMVDMAAGTGQRIIEGLPVSAATRETLSGYNDTLHNWADRIVDFNPTMPSSWMVPDPGFDMGDGARRLMGDWLGYQPAN